MSGTDGTITLGSTLDHVALASLREVLLARLVRGASVVVAAGELTEAPLALVQLLHAAHRRAAATGAALVVSGIADRALGEALEAYGFRASPTGAAVVAGDAWTGLSPN